MAETYQILVVDDDFSIVNIIETALKQAGYQVLTAHDGEAACHIVNTKHPHLIIMDVMMPQCNGIIATMRIRQNNNVPILMLSAKAEGSDRVLGLEAGADDYLVKPFYQQELLARVKALLRRYADLGSIRETKSEDQIQVGNIVLNTATKQLIVRGESVRLTATEFKILQVLMSNPGRVYSAEEIYERVLFFVFLFLYTALEFLPTWGAFLHLVPAAATEDTFYLICSMRGVISCSPVGEPQIDMHLFSSA